MSITPGAAGRGDLTAPAAPGGVSRTLLPGGLRVLTETVPGVRSVSLGIWVAVGSRDETPAQAGAAHYLEHLLFKGTRRRTAAEIAEEIDAVGGELNAFTAKEHTCYYAHVLDTDLPLAVDVLADVVTDAVLEPAHVELERSVVLEEIAMRDDDPEDLLGELFDDALFGDHPLGRPVVGTEESMRAMDRAVLHEFWRGRYTTPRMVVAAAGNLHHEHVVDLVADGAGPRRVAGRRAAPTPRRCAPAGSARARPASGWPLLHRRHRAGAPHDRRARRLPARPAPPGARRCSAPRSAAGPARGCSSRSARSAGWPTRCTRRTASYADAGSLVRLRRLRPRAARRGRDGGARRARGRRRERPDRRRAGPGARIAARRPGARAGGHPVADEPHRPLRDRPRPPAHDRREPGPDLRGHRRAGRGAGRASCWSSRTATAVVGPFDDEDALPASVRG